MNLQKIKAFLLLVVVIAMPLSIVLFIVWFNYSTFQDEWELRAIEERGIPNKAVITDAIHTHTGKSPESFTLYYAYEVDGTRYTTSKYVDPIHFQYNNTIGDSISIKYLADQPQVSDIPGNWGLENQWIQLIFLDIVVLLLIIIGTFHFYKKNN